jgi:hypothetical protein
VWGVLFSLVLMVVVSYLTKPQSREVLELYFGTPKAKAGDAT